MKRALFFIMSCLLMLSLTLNAFAGETAIEKTTVTITAEAAAVYEAASTEAQVIGTLKQDTVCSVIAYDGLFWKVELRYFDEDTVYNGYLQKVDATVPAVVTLLQADGEIKANGSFRFKRNQDATIFAVGEPDTPYTIEVYYSAGPSATEGLHAKTSDENGNVSWTWNIGGRTLPGTYRAIISGGGQSKTIYFEIEADVG